MTTVLRKISLNMKTKRVKKRVTKSNEFKPTVKMLKMLEILETEGFPASWTELAKKSDVTRKQIYEWRQNEEFNKWLSGELQRIFTCSIEIIKNITYKKAIEGEFSFIKLFFEITGIIGREPQESNDKVFEVEIREMRIHQEEKIIYKNQSKDNLQKT